MAVRNVLPLSRISVERSSWPRGDTDGGESTDAQDEEWRVKPTGQARSFEPDHNGLRPAQPVRSTPMDTFTRKFGKKGASAKRD